MTRAARADKDYNGWSYHRDPLTPVHRHMIRAIASAPILCSKTGKPLHTGCSVRWSQADNEMEIRYVVGGTINRRRYEERRTGDKRPLEWILYKALEDVGLDAKTIRREAQVADYRTQAEAAKERGSESLAKTMTTFADRMEQGEY